MNQASTTLRRVDECVNKLDAIAEEINHWSMSERLEFLQGIRTVAAALGAGERWRNLEGVIAFFRDHEMGGPGTWVSYVNAGVLEGVERGVAIALGYSVDEFDNAGSAAWAEYLTQLRDGRLATPGLHNEAWSRAKEIGTDAGLVLAEKRNGLKPTIQEQQFLRFAQIYNWGMRNRPVLDLAITMLSASKQVDGLTPELADWFMDVGDSDATRVGCEIAWEIAQVELPELSGVSGMFNLFSIYNLAVSRLPELVKAYQQRGASTAVEGR
ncbi:hypothetical protein [Actinopolymorpha pittospori]|uniref:Uncharacterized protein n=1 Tax=Actinopolymorpha pittospori TaxID=648752 RepID=A0A927N4G4_9ACTN|nr:hypothetical protein [Actinopolymorpha pittospori]MBE1612501.1 hypothetical protein [Actinopolymorpha pittospori]